MITLLPELDDLFISLNDQERAAELQNDFEQHTLKSLQNLATAPKKQGVDTNLFAAKGSKAGKLTSCVMREDFDILVKDPSPDAPGESCSLGSLDYRLIRQCPCSIWIVRERSLASRSKSIVVAIDASAEKPIEKELNRRLVELGILLAEFKDTSLELVFACDFDRSGLLKKSLDPKKYSESFASSHQRALEQLQALNSQSSKPVPDESLHILSGRPSVCLSEFCREHPVDTLVIGTVGETGLSGILVGNTTEQILKKVECSLLVVTPQQVKSPLQINLSEILGTEYMEQ